MKRLLIVLLLLFSVTARAGILEKLMKEGAVQLYHDYRSKSLWDWSGNDHQGTRTGNPTYTRKFMDFDGNGDFVNTTFNLNTVIGDSSDWSMHVKLRVEDNGNLAFIGRAGVPRFYLRNSGTVGYGSTFTATVYTLTPQVFHNLLANRFAIR